MPALRIRHAWPCPHARSRTRPLHPPTLGLLLAASVGLAAPARAQLAPQNHVLLQTADALPELPDVTVQDFTSLGTGPGGHALARLSLVGAGVTSSNRFAFAVLAPGAPMRIVARSTDQIQTPLGTWSLHTLVTGRLDAGGRVVLLATLANSQGVPAAIALLRETTPGEALQVLTMQGASSPLEGGPFPVSQVFTPFSVSRDGSATSFVTITGPDVTPANDDLILAHPASAPAAVAAREGQQLPGLWPSSLLVVSPTSDAAAVALSDGSLLVPVQTTTSQDALFRGAPPLSSAAMVLRSGQSTGLVPGQTISQVGPDVAASQDGSAAAIVSVVPGSTKLLYVQPAPGAPALPVPALRTGLPAPGLPGFTISEVAPSVIKPALVGGGGDNFLVTARVTRATPQFTGLALYAVGAAGDVRLVAREAQALADGVTIRSFEPFTWGIDAAGTAVFSARVESALAGPDTSVLLSSPSRPVPLLVLRGGNRGLYRTRQGDLRPATVALTRTRTDAVLPGNAAIADTPEFTIEVTSTVGLDTRRALIWVAASPCRDQDFNNDGVFPDDADIRDFLTVSAGGPCPTSTCDSPDFNNDGVFPDDSDLASFLFVLAGGAC